MALTGRQRRALRALGHHLRPVVQVGHENVSDTVVSACDQALADHELIKVKLGDGASMTRQEVGPLLAQRTLSELVQTLGRTLLLYRRHPEWPKLEI